MRTYLDTLGRESGGPGGGSVGQELVTQHNLRTMYGGSTSCLRLWTKYNITLLINTAVAMSKSWVHPSEVAYKVANAGVTRATFADNFTNKLSTNSV